MHIDIPFEYEVSFVPHRHRNPQTKISASRVAVEIREVPGADVRAIHRIASTYAGDRETGRYAPFPGPHGKAVTPRVVEYDGRLYVEACRADEVGALVSGHGKNREEGDERSPFHVHQRTAPARKDLTSISDFKDRVTAPLDVEKVVRLAGGLRPGSLRDDGGKARAAAIEARASEMIVHDGSVFVPTSDPVIAIVRDHKEDGAVIVTLDEIRPDGWSQFRRPTSTPLRDQRVEVFPLDRHAEAVEYATRMANEAGSQVLDAVTIESFDPDRVAIDGNWLTVRAASSILSAEGRDILSCHPEVATAYADIRDAFATHPGLCSPMLVKATDEYARAVATHGLPDEPLASTCALLASGGRRDIDVEARASLKNIGLVQLAHASSAMASAEASSRSWVRRAPILTETLSDDHGEATEVTSVGDAERVAEGLGSPARIHPALDGETLVAVATRVGRRAVPQGLIRFAVDLTIVESIGRDGRQASPQVTRLAHAQAMRSTHARSPEKAVEPMDEDDAAAFDF